MNPSSNPVAVTIVIPVWDSPYVEWLPTAVAATRAQDPEAPIVVVDNASKVSVPTLEGTTVVKSPERLSAGEARNLGLDHVDTDLVMFLDADDELLPGALDTVRRGIATDPTIAAFAMSLREGDTGRRHRIPHRFAIALARFPRMFALGNAIWPLYSTQGCAIFRTAWVRDCGGYADLSGPEDWILGVSQAFRGRVCIDYRPGLVYRVHQGSLAEDQSSRYLLLAARCVRERLRGDPAVPRWARALVPVIALMQALAILALRPLYRLVRRSITRLREDDG